MNPEERVAVRRRRTRAEVQQLVVGFASSGMRRTEFCRSHGLSWSTLNRHLKRHRRKRSAATPSGPIVAVELAGTNRRGQSDSAGLAVVLASGRRIEVGPGFDAHTLERLVSVLERV